MSHTDKDHPRSIYTSVGARTVRKHDRWEGPVPESIIFRARRARTMHGMDILDCLSTRPASTYRRARLGQVHARPIVDPLSDRSCHFDQPDELDWLDELGGIDDELDGFRVLSEGDTVFVRFGPAFGDELSPVSSFAPAIATTVDVPQHELSDIERVQRYLDGLTNLQVCLLLESLGYSGSAKNCSRAAYLIAKRLNRIRGHRPQSKPQPIPAATQSRVDAIVEAWCAHFPDDDPDNPNAENRGVQEQIHRQVAVLRAVRDEVRRGITTVDISQMNDWDRALFMALFDE